MYKSVINIVLFCPEIPNNTGNIVRSCTAFKANLHLIKPYGFFLNDKRMVRAGLNCWDKIQLFEHKSWEHFLQATTENKTIWLLTKSGDKTPDQICMTNKLPNELYFVFGQETKGLPKTIMDNFKQNQIRIPIWNSVRSINLANAVVCILYEYSKQNQYSNLDKQCA
ncbi:tRNA (uridine(34)/cytosine(34)/5-carboxymethylaminomethyluridine(34)-2'-O)-methyltransferase TrmL [Mycoplasmoides genitalium]|uniref:Putative tRNA (cytidine(34)-2'-O)-methyltransferase n=2 Tax=Mycoplasmoides genitalium TaxID=2097 RepID=TRML_MYCGE|nr:tRNA (uridine(34)/cytosine(34)/5-carboxymethylaminomethyluridine(34)-2'-O)-methyltransferase TrmL [Mycoplasmoides genitalium]P47588.1 RecName: Full=Putative tRNA (cytidine(34)-2'-O)-methyltransferase; AltName: Full=tRNA (cytidine/uridine-2'-O-)-methyltransferase [Mycoplasmoides genitalium G37]ABY79564.1 RNA methyltransferase, TrmH family, group 2 [synthetic Mycoplasma genitalium JCVI-1.0]AAC71571.1 RNA methyltransferase, TrmH family, group 2 [Mycoplasmoides genitalium G37]AFQ03188.1 RNA meth